MCNKILRYWQSKEYEPSVVSFSSADADVAANPHVRIFRIRPDRLWPARWFAAYMGCFDAVFCPGLHHMADWAALRARALLGRRPTVISTFELLVDAAGCDNREREYSAVAAHKVYAALVPKGLSRRYDAINTMADHIIAISPFLARQAEALYGPKVSSLPLGVDHSLFRPREWIKRTRPRVVGAGQVKNRKRPELFLKCASLFPQADFVWFGEGEIRQRLREDASREGLRNVEFPGALPPQKLAQEFAVSDIFVLPSVAEGVPKVSQEAAACGLAQIIFGFYEAPTVVNGRNGFVVWSDDQLLSRLRELIESPNLVETMGHAGIEMTKGSSWDIIAPQWEQRIIDALEGKMHRQV